LRILHLLNHTRRLNGHVHAAVDLACAQRELGHDVLVASEGGDFDDLLAEHGIVTIEISHRRRPYDLARSAKQLYGHIRHQQIDVVHAHMMTSAVLAWPACRLARVPLVTTVHNEFERSAILMGLGDRVIAVSKAVGSAMQRRGIPARKIRVVLNGTIGTARSKATDRAPMELSSPSILFVGGQHPRKGLPDLLEAFGKVHAEVPAAKLYVVGEGPYLDAYKALAAGMSCAGAVTFAGAQSNPFSWMAGADIFVLPSHADPAPLVISEAREAGCAMVGTKVDGIPQLLEHGEAGILVPPSDPERLGEVLVALARDPDLLRQWRERSQTNIGHLTIDRVSQETVQVYESAGVAPGR
jgi:glycosyltransferase involved in cell wall biosynthesis